MENDLRSLELYRWNIVAIPSISILSLSLSLPSSPASLVSSRWRTRRNAYTRASPIVHPGGGRGRFTYFGVRLTDNNVSSSFRRMAPLPRPRHRGADFSLLCALKNQPATLTHAYRARRTMRRTESPRCTCTRTSIDAMESLCVI